MCRGPVGIGTASIGDVKAVFSISFPLHRQRPGGHARVSANDGGKMERVSQISTLPTISWFFGRHWPFCPLTVVFSR